jgi:membrane-bound serine protease (ClpP class)
MAKKINTLPVLLLLFIATLTAKTVYVVPIYDMIDLGLAPFVKRVISQAEKEQAAAVIFRVNTLGGRLDAAVQIKDAILDAKVPTVAFIDKRAISAGALISLSADSIFMTKGATIGAATPVDMQGKKVSEKQVSYMRAEMRATAEHNGRPVSIIEAMVDENIAIDSVVDKGKLLTLTTEEALRHNVVDRQVETLQEVLSILQLAGARILELKENWAEKIVRFLSHPIVSSLLLTIGFLGVIFEVKSPGWGIGGTIGVIALILFFGSHFIVRLAGWGEIILFVVGIILLIAEVFYIPGFGVAGIAGILALFASIVLSFLGRFPTQAEIVNSLLAVIGTLAGIVILTVLMFRKMPSSNLFNRLVLATGEKKELGFSSAPEREELLGKQGVSLCDLRPSGVARFGKQRLDVITEGDYISKDEKIRVINIVGNRIIVKKA